MAPVAPASFHSLLGGPAPDERPASAGRAAREGLPVPPAEGGRGRRRPSPARAPGACRSPPPPPRPRAPSSGTPPPATAAAGAGEPADRRPRRRLGPAPRLPLPLNGSFDFSGAGARNASFSLATFGSFNGLPAAAYARPGTPPSGDEGGAGPGTPDARRHAPPLAVAAPHGAASAGSVADPADFEEDLSVMGLHKFLMTLIWSFGMGGGQGFHQAAAANAVVQTFGKTLRSDAVVSVDVAPAPAALNARPPPSGARRSGRRRAPRRRRRARGAGRPGLVASLAGRPSPPSSLGVESAAGQSPRGASSSGPASFASLAGASGDEVMYRRPRR
eukprot:tig00000555_g2129.t1